MPLKQPERIVYPAMREMDSGPKPQGGEMNFWSIQADRCASLRSLGTLSLSVHLTRRLHLCRVAWNKSRSPALYKCDRTYVSAMKPNVHTELV